MMHMIDFNERIARAIRKEAAGARRSQTDLAAALGLSQAAMSRRMRGATPFRPSEVERIATFLGVPLSTLVPVESDMQ